MSPPLAAVTDARQPSLQAALDALLGHLRLRLEPAAAGHAAPLVIPQTLQLLAAALGLSPFEQQLLLLVAAPQLDGRFHPLLARAGGDGRSLNLEQALALLDEVEWPALMPVSRLRRWQLLRPVDEQLPLASRLVIDEWLLHRLLACNYLPPLLQPWLQRYPPQADAEHQPLCRQVRHHWQQVADLAEAPILAVDSREPQAVAAAVAAHLGLGLYRYWPRPLPQESTERQQLAWLWERQALADNALLWVDGSELQLAPAAAQQLAAWLESFHGLVILTNLRLPLARAAILLPTPASDSRQQLQWWQLQLGSDGPALAAELPALAEQFRFSRSQISRMVQDWRQPPLEAEMQPAAARLWQGCRRAARQGLEQLAERVDSQAQWADLILPDAALASLKAIVAQVRQRSRVYRDWGFAGRGPRGLGISALFAGGSGTGKTLAAEVIANSLQLDLYRIDLAALVSKYIGETEKNLARVFAAAESSGAILLFDEADALFGKRSEVRDSHDRYANLEVSYLLQRIEQYHGLAILTSNFKQALDDAFLRRLRFVVHFPFPDAQARLAIWNRVFPPATPLADIDRQRLARLSLSGGHIRNMALTAAFLAADEGCAVAMSQLRRAAEAEFAKLEKALPAADMEGW